MELCSDGHEEVCYEGNNCPCCDMIYLISDKDDEIAKLQKELDSKD